MKLVHMAAICILLCSLATTGCSTNTKEATGAVSSPKVVNEVTEPPVKVKETVNAEVVTTKPNVQKVTFRSVSLDKDMKFNIYLPDRYEPNKKYPVLYLIHGYGSNENMWMPDLGIDQAASQLITEDKIKPLIMVSPQIDNSYGFNSDSEGNYSDYIIKDLIPYVDAHFSTDSTKEGRSIGGLSMGGWAALHNAFQYPEMFSKAGGHSPAIWMDNWDNTGDLKHWLYPSDDMRKERDPLLLADSQNLQQLSVYLDCGDQDIYKFYQGAEALYKKLQSKKVTSEYHHSPGGHEDAYWRDHLKEYLLFYAGK